MEEREGGGGDGVKEIGPFLDPRDKHVQSGERGKGESDRQCKPRSQRWSLCRGRPRREAIGSDLALLWPQQPPSHVPVRCPVLLQQYLAIKNDAVAFYSSTSL